MKARANESSRGIDCFEVEVISPPGLLIMKGRKGTQKKPLLPKEFKYAPIQLVKESLPIQYIFEYLSEIKNIGKNDNNKVLEMYEDFDEVVDGKSKHSTSIVRITNNEHLEPGQSTKDNETITIIPLVSGEYFLRFNFIIDEHFSVGYTDYVRVVVQGANH